MSLKKFVESKSVGMDKQPPIKQASISHNINPFSYCYNHSADLNGGSYIEILHGVSIAVR